MLSRIPYDRRSSGLAFVLFALSLLQTMIPGELSNQLLFALSLLQAPRRALQPALAEVLFGHDAPRRLRAASLPRGKNAASSRRSGRPQRASSEGCTVLSGTLLLQHKKPDLRRGRRENGRKLILWWWWWSQFFSVLEDGRSGRRCCCRCR